MNQVDNERATARELVAYAQSRGIDLEPLRNDTLFQTGQRWIFMWRKRDDLPASGRDDEPEGTLHYNMQGSISVLPSVFKNSPAAFQGAWSEAGTFENLDQAVELLQAWLLDAKEIDELPPRNVRRQGI
jgi:hypothetical protein